MKSKLLQWLAIVLIVEIGLLHIFNAQAEYEEEAYMGYLFAANFFGALAAAWGINHKQLWGWMLGLFIAIASVAGYIWSRTLGMPGMNVEEWFTPFGIAAMSLEGAFMILVLFRPWKIQTPELLAPAASSLRYILPVAGLVLIFSLSALTFQWDYEVTQAFGLHVGSLDQVSSMPFTSSAALEQEYGVQVSLVATSMMNSIVDVRLKIIDPDKAHMFLQNQAAMLVEQEALILAPHMHSHGVTRLQTGKIFSLFFPTQQIIHTGTEVSLVFGPVRIEPVVVQ